jgi:hypothetical protein
LTGAPPQIARQTNQPRKPEALFLNLLQMQTGTFQNLMEVRQNFWTAPWGWRKPCFESTHAPLAELG